MLARLVILTLALLSTVASARNAEGSHPWQGSGQLATNYLHGDLEPGGDGQIYYRLCNAQWAVPPEWGLGIEKWDDALGPTFTFDPVNNSCTTVKTGATLLRWEVGDECQPGALACWNTWRYTDHYAPHGSHNDILLGLIIFDKAKWDAVPNWRSYMPVHEFGHDLSLADHVSHNCAENTVMLNYLAGYFPPAPCGSDPTTSDLTSVKCNIYGGAGGGPWSAWEDLGGMVLNSAPAVAAWDCNRLDVFALGLYNYVYHTWYDGVWHPWENMTLIGTSAPAVASWAPGRLDVVVRGGDDAIWHIWYDGAGWHQWESLGGSFSYGAAASSWGPGRVDVFARNSSGAVGHKWYPGGPWSSWENLGGSAGGNPAAASWGFDRIDLFVRHNSAVSLYHKWWAPGWTSWVQEDPAFMGSVPAVTSWGLLRLDVFMRGLNGHLWHKRY